MQFLRGYKSRILWAFFDSFGRSLWPNLLIHICVRLWWGIYTHMPIEKSHQRKREVGFWMTVFLLFIYIFPMTIQQFITLQERFLGGLIKKQG